MIIDGVNSHCDPWVLRDLARQGVYITFIVANTSHLSQMMDQNPNQQCQAYLRKLRNEHLFKTMGATPSRVDIVSFLVKAAKLALTPKNFAAAWKRVGFRPWNPARLTSGEGSLQYHGTLFRDKLSS